MGPAVGTGAVSEGIVSLVLGTSGVVFATVNEVVPGEDVATANLALLPHTWAVRSGHVPPVAGASAITSNHNAWYGIDGNIYRGWTGYGPLDIDTGDTEDAD